MSAVGDALRERVEFLEAQRAEYRLMLRWMWRNVDRLRGGQSHDRPEENWRTYVDMLVTGTHDPRDTDNWFDDRTDPDDDFRALLSGSDGEGEG